EINTSFGEGGQFRIPKSKIVNIIISDTGIGIPQQGLDQIFDRFYQVDDSSTRKTQGSGIGLALTKELIELHHGTIHAESEEGKGTTFTLQLPLGKDHLKQEEITETPLTTPPLTTLPMTNDPMTNTPLTTPPLTTKPETILIIEDNTDMRVFIRENIEADYNVLEAEDGEQGINTAFDVIPDLIISDVMMPKMNGFQVCERLKTDERTSHIPIILLTAKAEAENKIQGLFNKSPNQFIRSIRLQHAREMLEKNAGNITEICFAVGFSNHSYFTKCFHEQFGKSPSHFKGK
ncbi:response regulator, partial [candidate division KSB1 bacterium]|nr:response regulator [candidate division KSB1 bacterium]